MPIEFKLDNLHAGFSAAAAASGEKVPVISRELVGPEDAALLGQRLEGFQSSIFRHIPNLPSPSRISRLVVVLFRDLTGIAYVDEFGVTANVRATKSIQKDDLVALGDFDEIKEVELSIDVPDEAGVIVVQSHDWKRALYYDLEPLGREPAPRAVPLGRAMAHQLSLLFGLDSAFGNPAGQKITTLHKMTAGLAELKRLLAIRSNVESAYQELFVAHPWLLGPQYVRVDRHTSLDDRKIPDFTGIRTLDYCRDIVEIKQPFLNLFRKDGKFTSAFNDAWNQCEGYLHFAYAQRNYLLEEKHLKFENPRCFLIVANSPNEEQNRLLREKQAMARGITIVTYASLVRAAAHQLSLIRGAGVAISDKE